MLDILCKKKGFTLVEILIVIMIIGVLSTLAVNGYTNYRRTALLDLSADNFISQIYGLRDKTIHGDFGSERAEEIKGAIAAGNGILPQIDSEAKCYGFYFSDNEVKNFEVNFVNKKEWDSLKQEWKYKGCDAFEPASLENSKFELDEMVSIISSNSNIVVYFIPPKGLIEAENYGSGTKITDKELTFTIKYGVSDEDKYKRKIIFDLISGKANVEKYVQNS